MTISMESLANLLNFDKAKEEKNKGCLILFSVLISFIAIYFIYQFICFKYVGEVYNDYFPYADALVNGILPYQPYNGLRWEYPPLAYLFMVIPRLFTSDPVIYTLIYIIMVLIVTLIGLWLIRKIAMKHDKNAKVLMLAYTASVLFLVSFYFDRFDVIVAVITIAAVYLYMEKKYYWAFILLSIGMFIKLYPGLLFLFFLIPIFANRDFKLGIRCLSIFLVTSIILIIPFILMSPDTYLSFITYHTNRGIQLESVFSSFALMLELFGLTSMQTISSYGSFNLEGGITGVLSAISFPLIIVSLIFFAIIYYRKCMVADDMEWGFKTIPMVSLVLVLVFILFNKVFSAQYMIWVVGLLMPALIYCCDSKQTRSYLLLFTVAAIDTCIMVAYYPALCEHEPELVLILTIRNVLLLVMLILIIRSYFSMKIPDYMNFKLKRQAKS